MSQQPPEHPSTYLVQDRSSQQERHRLQIQDAFITVGMGGVLPEQPDPSRFRRVLDVGCGTGGWLIETARAYPQIELLVGIDISNAMVDYAREQAQVLQVCDRVEFCSMDALRMLEFPDKFFDLVNQRAGASYVRTWEWRKLLQEYRRVTCPNGIIRVTEFQIVPESASSALTQLCDLLVKALYQAGHLFTPTSDGVTNKLESLLDIHGLRQIQTRTYNLENRPGTPSWQGFFEDVEAGFRTFLPFMRKWINVPDNYEEIYQQALVDMRQPDFVGIGRLLTAWGRQVRGV